VSCNGVEWCDVEWCDADACGKADAKPSMADSMVTTDQHSKTMQSPAVHKHACTSSCSSPCQLNVPVALTSVVAFALPHRFVLKSLEPRPMQVDNVQNSIQRPPIA